MGVSESVRQKLKDLKSLTSIILEDIVFTNFPKLSVIHFSVMNLGHHYRERLARLCDISWKPANTHVTTRMEEGKRNKRK